MYSIGIILPDIKDYFKETQEKVNLLSSLNTGFLFCSGNFEFFIDFYFLI